MGKILKELIQYNGIDTCDYKNLINFKQFHLDTILSLPQHKPDIEEILKVWIDHDIVTFESFDTPCGISSENQILTGKKLFLSADLNIKIEYVADNNGQSVNSIDSTIPVCEYITLPESFNECSLVFPSILIEDIYCEQQGCREIYVSIMLLAIADTN